MAEDRAAAGPTVKEKASQGRPLGQTIASMCPGWGPGPTGRSWAVPRAVDIPRRIFKPRKGTHVIVMGSSRGWPFFCWLGGGCQPFRGADSSLAFRGPQWESPSDLCTLEADGHLILRVDINIGDNLSGQERPLGAPQLNSSPLSAHSVEKGSHEVESCLCHWLAWANPISL